MKRPRSDVPLEYNLITAKTVNQGLESFQDDSIRCQSKSSSEFIETSTNDEEANKGKKNDYKNILHRKATAHKLANGSIFVKPELLCDLGCETPRLNYDSCLGREYRYFYAISSDVDLDNPGTVHININFTFCINFGILCYKYWYKKYSFIDHQGRYLGKSKENLVRKKRLSK